MLTAFFASATLMTGCGQSATTADPAPIEDDGDGDSAQDAPATAMPIQERRARAFVEALNAGDADGYEAFMQENRSSAGLASGTPQERAASYQNIRNLLGDINVVEFNLKDDTHSEIIVEDDHGERIIISLEHDPEEVYRIGSIGIESAGAAAGRNSNMPAVTIPPEWATLDDLLTSYQTQSGVPAWAAAVIRDGKIVDQAVAGQLSISNNTPVSLDSRFHWGSVTKSVTGTVIGKLVEDGILEWDAKIGEILSDIPMRDAYRNVTIAQLMAHAGGIPTYTMFDDAGVERLRGYTGSSTERREAFVADVLQEQPVGQPGLSSMYSNAGITIAGLMAERVSGKSWEDLVRDLVFVPAGMTEARFGWPATSKTPDQPQGHFGPPGGLQPMPVDYMSPTQPTLAPAGNVQSSIGDFARYALMHLKGLAGEDGPLQAKTIQYLHSRQPFGGEPGGGYYAFGWSVSVAPDGAEQHRHNGSAGSYYAEIRLYPEQNMGIVLLANVGGGYARPLSEPLFMTIRRKFSE